MTALARDCKWCGASMEGKRSDAIFCSRKCYAVSYRKTNPEYQRKYQRKHNRDNPDYQREYQRKYVQANPDYHSNYRQANRERIAERDRVKRHALKQETDQ